MAVAFANRFMAKSKQKSSSRPLVWKRYIDDIFSLWGTNGEIQTEFIDKAHKHYPAIKFTAEISDKETISLDTSVTYAPTTRPLKHFRTHISPCATHQELEKVSSRERG